MTTTLDTALHQLSSFQYLHQSAQQQQQQQHHHNGLTQHNSDGAASLVDECCIISHDINDFCCAPVEPSACCAPSSRLAVEALECCGTHSQATINGFTVQEIECCIMESASQEGMESDCCQDLVQPGALVARQTAPTCCSEHPDIVNDCCQTCCPDAMSPSSSSTSVAFTAPTPTLSQPSHYFPAHALQCSASDPWDISSICNHAEDHVQRNIDSNNHSAFHFLTSSNSSHSFDNHGHHHVRGTASNMSQVDSLEATPTSSASLPSDLMDEAQIDHMIRCLWTGCTAEFMSQDDLLPHVSQLHMPMIENDHALCLWESCETEQPDGSKLLQHLRADHHIVLPTSVVSEAELLRPEPKTKHIAGGSHPKTGDSNTLAEQENEGRQEQHRCGWKDCGKAFANYDSLTTHLSEDHIGTGKSEYVCGWEGCERNGRGFGQRQKAMRHIQTHTGDKPYQCQLCKKRFSEANIMAQHMRTHTGEKPFKCPEPGCGREFSISGALTIHRRVHTGEKPFKCKFEGCNKWFAESSNLTKHLRVHTGERPFQCSFPGCEKRFSRPDQVTRHKRTHMTAAEKATEKMAAEALARSSASSGKASRTKNQKRSAPSTQSSSPDESSQEYGATTDQSSMAADEDEAWSSMSPASLTDDHDAAPPGDSWQQTTSPSKRLRI